jgi:hypothetical protein
MLVLVCEEGLEHKFDILAEMKLRFFIVVNMADMDDAGTDSAHAENCSFAGSSSCGGETWSMVWIIIWTESASSTESSLNREESNVIEDFEIGGRVVAESGL